MITLLDETRAPSVREIMGRLLSGAETAAIAIAHVRLAAIDLQPANLDSSSSSCARSCGRAVRPTCPRSSRYARYGVTTNATASEASIAADAPIGIGRMYGPMSPETNAMGRIAAITANVARMVGLPTSSTASTAATSGVRSPIRRCR